MVATVGTLGARWVSTLGGRQSSTHSSEESRSDDTSDCRPTPVWGRDELRYVKASDEHGVVELPASSGLAPGEALMLVPGHCDPTFNLYDELVCVRGDRVEAIWPISARGALL